MIANITEQPTLLMIDTATAVCSLATSHGEELIGHLCERERQGEHAAVVAPMADRLLDELRERGLTPDAIAVSAGPGSYTGLRIASSLAKGLAHGFAIPLIAISTLELMAAGYRERIAPSSKPIRLCPMIDARRMEVYTAVFDAQGQRLQDDQPRVLSAQECFASDMDSVEYHFFGSGSGKCTDLWRADYIVDSAFVPEARYMHALALQAYRAGQFVDLAYWTPNYLKEYVAVVGQNKVLGR